MYELYENVKRLDFFVSIIVFWIVKFWNIWGFVWVLQYLICVSYLLILIETRRTFLQVSDLAYEPLGFYLFWKTVAVVTVFQLPLTLVFLMLQLRLQFVYQFHFQNIVETLAYFRNEMKKSISTPLTILLYKIKNNNVSTDQLLTFKKYL